MCFQKVRLQSSDDQDPQTGHNKKVIKGRLTKETRDLMKNQSMTRRLNLEINKKKKK